MKPIPIPSSPISDPLLEFFIDPEDGQIVVRVNVDMNKDYKLDGYADHHGYFEVILSRKKPK